MHELLFKSIQHDIRIKRLGASTMATLDQNRGFKKWTVRALITLLFLGVTAAACYLLVWLNQKYSFDSDQGI
jgi:hypothetical protein